MKRVTGHGEGVLDALLCLALLDRAPGSMPALSGPEPELDLADRQALDALGPDLVERILAEDLTDAGQGDRRGVR